MAETCSNCRFWDVWNEGLEPGSTGDCRKRAPAINDFLLSQLIPRNVRDQMLEAESHIYTATAFPLTHIESWCGEYQARRGDEDLRAIWDRYRADYENSLPQLDEQLLSIPAETLAGLEARLLAAAFYHSDTDVAEKAAVTGIVPAGRDFDNLDFADRLLWRAIEDIRRMGGQDGSA